MHRFAIPRASQSWDVDYCRANLTGCPDRGRAISEAGLVENKIRGESFSFGLGCESEQVSCSHIFAMKCLTSPSGFFRRSQNLGLLHKKANLSLVGGTRHSLSSTEEQSESGSRLLDDNKDTEESVADSFSDITRENEWVLLQVAERLPHARSDHAAVASGTYVYIFGGESVDGILNDVQVFNIDRCSWKELHSGAAGDHSSTPSAKSQPIAQAPCLFAPFAAVWKGLLIVVGCDMTSPFDSPIGVYTFNPAHGTWIAVKPDGDLPEARLGYGIVQVKSILIVFGGEDSYGRIGNDVFALDLDKMTWTLLQTTGGKPPPRRYHAMACYGGQYVWIYGGKSYATYYNDLYCLDLKQLMWSKVNPSGPIPAKARAGHVGIIRGDNFYIVGGENRSEEMVDTLAFDMRKRLWLAVTRVHNMSPLAHDGISVSKVSHEGRQYLLAFGGRGILLSSQIYAMLLPSVDQLSEHGSSSSSDSFRCTSIPNRISRPISTDSTTLPPEKTSPTDPFEFHRGTSASSDSAAPETGNKIAPDESLTSSTKEDQSVKTKASTYSSMDASRVIEELNQPSRLNKTTREHSLSLQEIGQFDKDFITIERDSRMERSDNAGTTVSGAPRFVKERTVLVYPVTHPCQL